MNLDDLRKVVRAHDSSRPRSRQQAIGPSEAGTACPRRLAYKMLGVEPVNTSSDPWAAIVGTSVHEYLDQAFAEENKRLGFNRWATSLRVELPTYMSGTIDLYDDLEKEVIDHKVVGATTLKKARDGVILEQYRTQVHLYATGLLLRGHEVKRVGVVFWSRSGQLKDAVAWSEPYDEEIVEAALRRIDALRTVTAAGTSSLPLIPTGDAFCLYCPYFLPASTELETACPGHTVAKAAA